jgi:hypothetical protein
LESGEPFKFDLKKLEVTDDTDFEKMEQDMKILINMLSKAGLA